ncbi:hypothetical protein [Arthrobacter cupressi]|uniref:hypothetical protein n=1 Tax=Arthrobacter cupressi TaxID=1045773 RepID=UPI0009453854|nr:hypothetical protein [Arthrobacter cupressi]NYD77613.1 hypothetical protein [Arthrobacter cupressi]
MLNYFRERQQALEVNPQRRAIGYVSGAVVVALMVLVFVGIIPQWIFWAAFAASCVLDITLTRKWVRDDALKAHQADHPR